MLIGSVTRDTSLGEVGHPPNDEDAQLPHANAVEEALPFEANTSVSEEQHHFI